MQSKIHAFPDECTRTLGRNPLRVSPVANPQSIRAAAVAGAVRFSPFA